MEHLDLLSKGHYEATSRTAPASSRSTWWVYDSSLRRLISGKRRIRQFATSAFATCWLLGVAPSASASDIQNSKLVKGTEKLIGDVTTWLMILAPVVAGLLIIYFCIRRSAADEMDTKKWNNRIIVAIISCIGAVLGSATLNLIIGYYK
ncbi:Mbov_0395 family pilin-like conjugal transfer protein [Paenibacillus luteus]|uniref:Mbov_0395 family pilin-like conjugal transfer protein n=1 Tax=Paenibacillus luteus TaxID=2545753 RepID=UPI003BAC85EF